MPKFKYNASGVIPIQYALLPVGKYYFAISAYEEKFTNKNDTMYRLECSVTGGAYEGSKAWHNITFLPKGMPGAGFAIHFLKSIGEPWEGEFEVDAERWLGKRFLADVIIVTHKKDGTPLAKPQNSITAIFPVEDGKTIEPKFVRKSPQTIQDESEIPF